MGVTPFLSWLRSLDSHLPYRVEFFFTADGEPPFADEIREIAARHDALNIHLVNALEEGRLVPKQVLDAAGGPGDDLSVFMCGPKGMLNVFETSFRRAGVRPGRIRREHFDWR